MRMVRAQAEDFEGDVDAAAVALSIRQAGGEKYADIVRPLNACVCFDKNGRFLAHKTADSARRDWFRALLTGQLIDLLPELMSCFDYFDFEPLVTAPFLFAWSSTVSQKGLVNMQHDLFLRRNTLGDIPGDVARLLGDLRGLNDSVWTVLGREASDVLRFAFSRCGRPVTPQRPDSLAYTHPRRLLRELPTKIGDLKRFTEKHVTLPFKYNKRDPATVGASETVNTTARELNCALQLVNEIKKDVEYLADDTKSAVGIAAEKAYYEVGHALASDRDLFGPHLRRVVVSRDYQTLRFPTAYQASIDEPGRFLHTDNAPKVVDRANTDYAAGAPFHGSNTSGSRRAWLHPRNKMGVVPMPGLQLSQEEREDDLTSDGAVAFSTAFGVTPVFTMGNLECMCTTLYEKDNEEKDCHLAIPGRMRYKCEGIHPEYDYSETLMGESGRKRETQLLLRTSPGIMEFARNIRSAVTPLLNLLRVAKHPDSESVWITPGNDKFFCDETDCKPLATVLTSEAATITVPEEARRFARVRDQMYSTVMGALKALLLGFYSYEFCGLHVSHVIDIESGATNDTILKKLTVHGEALEHIAAAMRYNGASGAAMTPEQILDVLETRDTKSIATIDPRCLCVPLLPVLDFVTPRFDPEDVSLCFRRGDSREAGHKRGSSLLDRYEPTDRQPPFKRFRKD